MCLTLKVYSIDATNGFYPQRPTKSIEDILNAAADGHLAQARK